MFVVLGIVVLAVVALVAQTSLSNFRRRGLRRHARRPRHCPFRGHRTLRHHHSRHHQQHDRYSLPLLQLKLTTSLPATARTMGSRGWAQCYWCDRWENNMYIIDWMGAPLCGRCMDWYVDGGKPYSPTAIERSMNHIAWIMHRLLPANATAPLLIAEFLRYGWEP